jgi:hypothetical protein
MALTPGDPDGHTLDNFALRVLDEDLEEVDMDMSLLRGVYTCDGSS